MLQGHDFAGADKFRWRELHVDGGAGRVEGTSELIAHRQYLNVIIVSSIFIFNEMVGKTKVKSVVRQNNIHFDRYIF